MKDRLASLKGASWLFIATWLVHSADHIRRGTSLTSDGVVWAGNISAILSAIALTLVFTNHGMAPMVAAAVFGSVAVGVTATHLLPGWGYFSEPLLINSAADSWAAVAAIPEIFAAVWLSWVAFAQARANDFQTAPA